MRYLVHGPDGNTYGPADLETLYVWASQGRVTPETMLAEEGTDRLVRAGSVLDFAQVSLQPLCRHCAVPLPPQAPFCPNGGVYAGPVAPGPTGAERKKAALTVGCLAGLGVGGTILLAITIAAIVAVVVVVALILGVLHQCLTNPIQIQ